MVLHTDFAYRPDADRGYLDLMRPDGDGPFPVVLVVVGGAWHGGEKEWMYAFGEWLVAIGIAAVIPNYRLAPAFPHPAQEEDLFRALEWIATNAREHRLDPDRVGLTGVSAGGHLAALVSLKATRMADPPCRIRCMLPICPATDMLRLLADNPAIRPALEELAGGPVGERESVLRDTSPITHVHSAAPPCLATHGAADSLLPVSQTTAFVDALRATGADATAIVVPGADHTAYMPDVEPQEPLGGLAAYQGFFRRHLLDGT